MFKFETTNDIYLLTNYLALGNEGAVIEKAQEIVLLWVRLTILSLFI